MSIDKFGHCNSFLRYLNYDLDMNDNKIINLAPPEDMNDAVTKQYVDEKINSVGINSTKSYIFSGLISLHFEGDTKINDNTYILKCNNKSFYSFPLQSANIVHIILNDDLIIISINGKEYSANTILGKEIKQNDKITFKKHQLLTSVPLYCNIIFKYTI